MVYLIRKNQDYTYGTNVTAQGANHKKGWLREEK